MNEDFLDCWVSQSGETIGCIADGLGGMGGGDVASKLAVSRFKRHLLTNLVSEVSLLDAARSAHEAIREAQGAGTTSRMATTLTAVALLHNRIIGVHCGDSRSVIARGKGIKRLTKDHSEGQSLFEAGKLSHEELSLYPRKHILKSALGDREPPQIETFVFDLMPGDRIILTTDGVHNLIFLREMQGFSSLSASPTQFLSYVAQAINQRGANDNYSILALFAE